MKIYVKSVKQKEFFSWSTSSRFYFHPDHDEAREFSTIGDAYNAAKSLPKTHKAKVVIFDGIEFWNVSPTRA